MLNKIPEQLNKMARAVIEHHPNTYNCQIFRKVVTRTEPQTMGGIAVLDSEDEESITFEFICNGFALQTDTFQASAMFDNQGANNGFSVESKFVIAPENIDLVIKKHDIVYLLLGDIAKLAWEVTVTETVLNIPPFSVRYIMNQRDDLDII